MLDKFQLQCKDVLNRYADVMKKNRNDAIDEAKILTNLHFNYQQLLRKFVGLIAKCLGLID